VLLAARRRKHSSVHRINLFELANNSRLGSLPSAKSPESRRVDYFSGHCAVQYTSLSNRSSASNQVRAFTGTPLKFVIRKWVRWYTLVLYERLG
jgi:hypothetical protein